LSIESLHKLVKTGILSIGVHDDVDDDDDD
jgi:hypothetical protein